MDITALHLQFSKLGWEGVAAFAAAVKEKECGGVSMDFMRRTFAISTMKGFDGGNENYSVENYLSDLLSRKDRLSKENVRWLNATFARFAGGILANQNW